MAKGDPILNEVALKGDLPAGGNKVTGLGAPTGAGDAARKDEVDGCEKTVNKGAANGYASLDASQKVVEDPATAFIKPDGSVAFTGDQAMGGKKLTGLGVPTVSGDAARKDEVDTKANEADVIKKDGSVAFTGDQAMGAHKITGLGMPGATGEAARLDEIFALLEAGKGDPYLVNAIRGLTDPYLLDLLSFESSAPYTEQGEGTPTFNYKGTSVELKTSGADSDQAWLYKTDIYTDYVYQERKLIFEVAILNLDSVANQVAWLILSSDHTALPGGNMDLFGFQLENNALKGVVQNGLTAHTTDLATTLTAGAQVIRLKAILYYGEKCEFYVNDELKGTEETINALPDQDSNLYFQAIVEAEEAAAKGMEIGRALLYSPRSYWLSKDLVAEASPAACGMLKIRNPERTNDIIVDEVLIDITTGSTGAATADIGVGTSASDDTLLDGIDLQTVQVHNNVDDKGANGRKAQRVAGFYYVVGTASADTTGLVGKAHVHYRLA